METAYVDKLKDLIRALEDADKMLWERIQSGHFDSRVSAAACLKAAEHVTKALDIVAENLSQLPLPAVDAMTGELRV